MEEEFQEAEILWPADGSDDDRANSQGNDLVVGNGGEAAPIPFCSVRPKAEVPPTAATAPVEISRRKRRCRPWAPASEYDITTFDQETDVVGDGDAGTDDAKGTTSEDGLVMVPPHVVVARRRLVVVGGRTAAYSMCAGKGRTLKGRDLRDVRNLVLKMTGFIEE